MAVRETTVTKTHTHKHVFTASVQEPHENRVKQDQPSVDKPQGRRSARRHNCSVEVKGKFTVSDSLTALAFVLGYTETKILDYSHIYLTIFNIYYC